MECELCNRIKPLQFHHLIPKKNHKNKWFKKRFSRDEMNSGIDICKDCHKNIHRHIEHKSLGREYNTKDLLLTHPEIVKFTIWIKNK